MELGRFGAAFAGILIAAALSCTAGPAAAQTTTVTYVSNGNQSNVSEHSGTEFAQNFATGVQEGGYPLTSVEILLRGTRGQAFSVSVCSVDSDGEPTSTCTPLTPPDSFPPVSQPPILVFTAPENTVLAAPSNLRKRHHPR